MKRTLSILSLVLIMATQSVKAQEYSKGDWGLGPVIGISASTDFKDFDNISLSGNIGLYGDYAFTDLIKGIVETKYEYRFNFDRHFQYLNVPALVAFQLGSGYIALGAQYSICLATPKTYIVSSNTSFNYPSALLEFSYRSLLGGGGNSYYYGEGRYRNTIRLGYALMPIKYLAENKVANSNPFFIEFLIRFNLGKYFGKNTAKDRVRRR
jgi:hypothetical protein